MQNNLEYINNKKRNVFILGAGITGLAAGWKTKIQIYEVESYPGGICSSYYLSHDGKRYLHKPPANEEVYRFEIGGGHWIFGTNRESISFLERFSKLKSYSRSSSVYFSHNHLFVPYPLQNNLRFLKKEIIARALKELSKNSKKFPLTMKEWLHNNFGKTLCNLFFYPFHNLYTANLYDRIAPQDAFKSPVNISQVIQGASRQVTPVGYNVNFVYPIGGLNGLINKLAKGCNIVYGRRVIKIDLKKKVLHFSDGKTISYRKLISTLPLNKIITMTGLRIKSKPDPYTSVLVLNIGAVKGNLCPNDHWLYIPNSKSGFHRVGFYSNVDASFIPRSSRKYNTRVSIYVERAFREGQKPTREEIKRYTHSVVRELKAWGFIKEVEVADPTWIEVAYTWNFPSSQWKKIALEALKKNDIYSIGRYGQWRFQGIAESIQDGLQAPKFL